MAASGLPSPKTAWRGSSASYCVLFSQPAIHFRVAIESLATKNTSCCKDKREFDSFRARAQREASRWGRHARRVARRLESCSQSTALTLSIRDRFSTAARSGSTSARSRTLMAGKILPISCTSEHSQPPAGPNRRGSNLRLWRLRLLNLQTSCDTCLPVACAR